MITKITKKQQKYFDDLIQKYLHEITVFPKINKQEAEEAINEMYKNMGEEKPIIIYGKNPLETVFMCGLIKQKDSQLRSQLDSLLYLQLSSQLYSQLSSQLHSRLYSQLRSQLSSRLRSRLDSQLSSQLRSQLSSQLHSQLDSQLRSQLRSQLHLQLDSLLYSQLSSQLHSRLYSQFHLQLYSQFHSQLYSQLRETNDHWYVSLWWRDWDCYYQFAEYIGVKFDKEKLELYNKFLRNVYFCIPYKGICFVSENPRQTYWNDKQQLHRDGGSCIEFDSSLDISTLGIYCLNGIRVSQELATTPSGLLKKEMFYSIQNADERTEFLKKFGLDRMLSEGIEIDSYTNYNIDWIRDSEYKLFNMAKLFQSIDYAPYLYMKNQTTGVYHLEGVNPKCRTVIEALQDRYPILRAELNNVSKLNVEIK